MKTNVIIPDSHPLSEREQTILQTIIHMYLLNAVPVGSRSLSKYLQKELKLSPATIRNIMADLEDMEYISHPHTSAGRIPTDKGYRVYVDSMMKSEDLTVSEVLAVNQQLALSSNENVLKDASRVLGLLSKYLGIVEIPHLSDMTVKKIELISISSNYFLVVLALDSNIVRTLTLEAHFEIDNKHLNDISNLLNERISNKKLSFIKENFKDMILQSDISDSPIIRLFVESIDNLFELNRTADRIHIAGTQNLLTYPEFDDIGRIKGVIELIENEDIIIHILDKYEDRDERLRVMIGSEMQSELLEDYSLVVSNYEIGSAMGYIGLIGPKRMNYSKMVSLVQYVANLLTDKQAR